MRYHFQRGTSFWFAGYLDVLQSRKILNFVKKCVDLSIAWDFEQVASTTAWQSSPMHFLNEPVTEPWTSTVTQAVWIDLVSELLRDTLEAALGGVTCAVVVTLAIAHVCAGRRRAVYHAAKHGLGLAQIQNLVSQIHQRCALAEHLTILMAALLKN